MPKQGMKHCQYQESFYELKMVNIRMFSSHYALKIVNFGNRIPDKYSFWRFAYHYEDVLDMV